MYENISIEIKILLCFNIKAKLKEKKIQKSGHLFTSNESWIENKESYNFKHLNLIKKYDYDNLKENESRKN